ncbi:MAG: hypothetical protein BHV95_07590 [Clostridiales bacterium Nov_37_41]|nr:MAG: hypothetical protein BHV95_07590 [Clostridiales bacterium Nov_37_41]
MSCKKRGFKNGNKRRKCEGLKQSRTVEEKKDWKNQRPRAKFIKVNILASRNFIITDLTTPC